RRAPAAACLGVVTALAALGVVAPDGHDQGPLSVAAVQGGGPRGLRAVDSDPRRVFDAHLEASRRLVVPGSVDLVLWPEDVVDVDHTFAGSPEEAELSELARELGATVVAGVVEEEAGRAGEAGRFRNAAVVFGPDGAVVSRYDKVHRVPFGEYVPWRSFLDGLVDLSAVPRDAVAGEGAAVVGSPHGRLAVVISYEVFFADRARSGVTAGGRLLLVPTNASSYTTEQVPAQEVAVARLRAVETGRWTVQAAPTGYSVIVDHRGRVVVQGGLGGQEVLAAEVRLRSGLTLASRAGDWPVLVLAGLVFGLSWAIRKKT
ncbi:MAG: apolipoprotein N-acyltransferase, partial [Actinomycetota bacterium]